MPQLTITLDEDVFVEILHYCAKGHKSRFVNAAVREAILTCTDFRSGIISPNAMLAYGKGDIVGAKEWVLRERARRDDEQESLAKWSGEE